MGLHGDFRFYREWAGPAGIAEDRTDAAQEPDYEYGLSTEKASCERREP